MRFFQKIAEGIDTLPLLHAVMRQPDLWNANDLRTSYPRSPQSEVDDIWLRFNDLARWRESRDVASVVENPEVVWYPAAHRLPQARPLVFGLMARVEGERLGRVLITRLAPGRKVHPHEDGGGYADYYSRYHIILQNLPGSIFRAGNEDVCMKAGEVWWFDNKAVHEVVNNSADDRLTMVVDIRTFK